MWSWISADLQFNTVTVYGSSVPLLLLDTNILSPHLVPHLKIGLLSLEFSFFLFFLFCYCSLQCVAAFYEAQCPQTILLLPLPSSTVLSTFKTKWEKIFKILRLPSVTQDKFKDTNCIFLKNLRGYLISSEHEMARWVLTGYSLFCS